MAGPVEALRKVAQDGVVRIALDFKKPDDDFAPALMFVDGGGTARVVPVPLSGPDEDQTKARAARFIEFMLSVMDAQAASLILSVWTAAAPKGMALEEARSMRASKMPNRKEVLWLQVTDGKRYEVWSADLLRHDSAPPTVGRWESAYKEGERAPEGRFQLYDIFRRARGLE